MEQLHQDTAPLTLLKYFSIFRHPLKLAELFKFSGGQEDINSLEAYMEEMVASGTVKKINEFYLYEGDEKDVEKRLKGEQKAARVMPDALRAGRFIAAFPFVKFVGISGSLSKGYAGDKTDFDYFIIAANNTLWICRTLLHLVKKLSFLVGKQHWMCMNYFIDERHLELEERNLFTRIELSTLIPVYNEAMYRLLLLKNKNGLPNYNRLACATGNTAQGKLESYIQAYEEDSHKWLRPLNLLLMKWTDIKWRRKWKKKGYPMEDYDLAFKTTPYISKNHPKNYQKTVLKQLRKD